MATIPKGPSAPLTFLYYFATATLFADVVFAYQLGLGFNDRATLQLGLIIGLCTGVVGLYMNRSRTLSLQFTSAKKAQTGLDEALAELGFGEKSLTENGYWIYTQPGWRAWFAGKMLVVLDRRSGTVVGRASNIRQLERIVQP